MQNNRIKLKLVKVLQLKLPKDLKKNQYSEFLSNFGKKSQKSTKSSQFVKKSVFLNELKFNDKKIKK